MDQPNGHQEPGSISTKQRAAIGFFILAFLPLLLSGTATTISEDAAIFLLVVIGIVGWRKKWSVPPTVRFLLESLTLGFLFTIVWRHQLALLPTWGRLAYWPVLALGLAVWCAGGSKKRAEGPLGLLPLALLITIAGLTLSQVILPATLPALPHWYEQDTADFDTHEELPTEPIAVPLHWYRSGLLMAHGLIIVGLAALILVLRSPQYREKRVSYLLIPLLFGMVAGARGLYRDASASAAWWQAGQTERSVRDWIGPDNKTARKTRQQYAHVLQIVEQEGGYLVDKCGLDFLLRYRIAETAQRMHQPDRVLRALPPAQWDKPSASRRIADLWTVEDLNRLRRKAQDPRYKLALRSHRQNPWESAGGAFSAMEVLWSAPAVLEFHVDIYVDHEMTSDGSTTWLLDRWGRVFRLEPTGLVPVWESARGEGRTDAVDLEIWDGTVVVAYRNGEIRVSGEISDWVPGSWRMSLRPGYQLVDIERSPVSDSVVAVSSYGTFSVIGDLPESFPIPEEPLFYWDAAVDFEFSSDGLGWYVLDTYGVIHAASGGGRLPMASDVPDSPYWTLRAPYAPEFTFERDAVDIELDALGRGVCLLNGRGEVWTISERPFREVYRPFPNEQTFGLGVSLAARQDGAAVVLHAPGDLVVVP